MREITFIIVLCFFSIVSSLLITVGVLEDMLILFALGVSWPLIALLWGGWYYESCRRSAQEDKGK